MSTETQRPGALVAQSSTLREQMARVSAAEKNRDTIDAWQPLSQRLPEACAEMERLLATLRVLHARKLVPGGAAPAALADLKEKLAALRESLLNDPSKVMQRNRWPKTEVAITGAAQTLTGSLLRAWKAFAAGLSPELDDWAPFLQSDQFGSELRQIRRLQEELAQRENTLPQTADELAAVEAKSTQIHELVKKLDFGAIPAEVQKFLQRVLNPAGATLADLDPAVFEWLLAKGRAGSFKVSLGNR